MRESQGGNPIGKALVINKYTNFAYWDFYFYKQMIYDVILYIQDDIYMRVLMPVNWDLGLAFKNSWELGLLSQN